MLGRARSHLTDACLLAHAYIHTCIHTYNIHSYIHTCTHAYIHAYIHTCIHTCMHTYIHTDRHTYIHPSMHPYIHTYIHTSMHTYIHTYIHSYIHTCTHAYIHAYIHKYTHAYVLSVHGRWVKGGSGVLRVGRMGHQRCPRIINHGLRGRLEAASRPTRGSLGSLEAASNRPASGPPRGCLEAGTLGSLEGSCFKIVSFRFHEHIAKHPPSRYVGKILFTNVVGSFSICLQFF